jgi:hypothetical protein
MAFTKYASLENTQVLEIKGSPTRREASLDKLADFEDYRTEDGFLYARLRAISSRVNKNHDGWPSVELAGGPDAWQRYTSNARTAAFSVEADRTAKFGYSTFLGKPVFVDHHNSDPSRARGVVVDSKLHVEDGKTSSLDPYYASAPDNHKPPTWVELLVEIDAKSFPKFAAAIIEGAKNPDNGMDGWSMGCNVEKTVCSICKNAATSPEEYCRHVKLKGAHFDHTDDNGRKVSKKAYEDCYGIQFFEISGVFDPADETALSKEVKTAKKDELTCPDCGAMSDGGLCDNCEQDEKAEHDGRNDHLMQFDSSWELEKLAEAPMPQKDMTTAPEHVDTLRDDDVCPVCGTPMDQPTCKVCDYTKPPDGFDNPDLSKAQQQDQQGQDQQQGGENLDDLLGDLEGKDLASQLGPGAGQDPTKATISPPTANVTTEMSAWELSVHPKVAGRINTVEKPVKPSGPVSNDPKETVLSDQERPVTSRTASDLIAAANKENTMERVADAASGAPAAATPDKRVDTVGVGGVLDPSNEAASKADAQVDVEGIGGTGVEGVDADSHDHVDHGDEHTKTTEDSGPTKTWSGTDGNGVTRQESPVTNDPFPASDEGVKAASQHTALDAEPFPKDDNGLAGGGAVKGVQPVAEQFGERVDVLEPVTTPENNSGPTKTWSGTDGNGVLKQQDPVTNDTLEGSDLVNLHSSKRLFAAFKLADLEVEMGLIQPEEKYDRVAQLEQLSAEEIAAETRMASRVKQAATIRRQATRQGGVGRVPSMRPAAAPKTASTQQANTPPDEALFM